jgi:hypothetical protein
MPAECSGLGVEDAVGGGYFFFEGGDRKEGPAGAGLGFSAFGLRISRLLFF